MRHRVSHRKLGRVTEHRIAMLRNQASALLKFEHIETTVPKAKELRPFVERIITIAKRGLAAGEANGRTLHARRLVLRDIQDREIVSKLFDTIAPRFEARPGRIHADSPARLSPRRQRRGRADRARRQRVRPQRRQRKRPRRQRRRSRGGVGGRLRAAAQRLRGKKAEGGEGEDEAEPKKAKPAARKPSPPSPTPAARPRRPPRRARREEAKSGSGSAAFS